jgi:DNA-binding response OmpR family regulator
VEVEPQPRREPAAGPGPQARPAAAPVVLIVEDDEKLAALIRRMLGRAGFDSILAPTGDAALAAMRGGDPAAAVLDVMIPHPDGIEVCRQFRRDGWSGPIIAISARNSALDRERVAAAGADVFFSKPFRLSELITTLENLHDHNALLS